MGSEGHISMGLPSITTMTSFHMDSITYENGGFLNLSADEEGYIV